MSEKHFDFRSRLACVHPLMRDPASPAPAADEIALDSSWRIAVPDGASEFLRLSALRFQAYLADSMLVELPVISYSAPEDRMLYLTLDPAMAPNSCRIDVSADGVRLAGSGERAAARGWFELEDRMDLRGAPVLQTGVTDRTALFSPRMTHSGWELDVFPDPYLERVARAGMDAIVLFIMRPPDVTRNGRCDVPDLIRRAASFGLDVYLYPVMHCALHPSDPGAEAYYEDLYGSLVRAAPGVRGIVFVGESCAFPSRDPHSVGYWWDRSERKPGETRPYHGFWPSSDFPEWLTLVRDTLRRHEPDIQILFWTYNWAWTPEEDRLKLIRALPEGITLHVTLEMGQAVRKIEDVEFNVADYTITAPGPSAVFESEAAEAAKRGIPLTAMTNTGGETWDCGTAPYVPAPYLWKKRFDVIRHARAAWKLGGLMESHHFGWFPNPVSELAKIVFTAETENDFNAAIRRLAERDFGRENADAVLAVWRDWSDALFFHSSEGCDQYGALRVGPVYPLVFPGDPPPDPPQAEQRIVNGIPYGGKWCITEPDYHLDERVVPGHLRLIDKELALLAAGNARLAALLPRVPEMKRENANRLAALGEYYFHTVATMKNVKRFFLAGRAIRTEDAAGRAAALEVMAGILDEETANVRAAIPAVEIDSRLGWEPTIGYIADRAGLEWKLEQLARTRVRLTEYGKTKPEGKPTA